MSEQFELPLNSNPSEKVPLPNDQEILINEIAYEWPEEVRSARYKELIGQSPRAEMSEEDIAKAILNPEKEILRVRALNMEEDKLEDGKNYPGGFGK